MNDEKWEKFVDNLIDYFRPAIIAIIILMIPLAIYGGITLVRDLINLF